MNDSSSSYDNEYIDFILRRVDIWKEANRKRIRIYLQKAFGKLIVDFCALPSALHPRVAPVPAWRRAKRKPKSNSLH